MLGVRNYQMMFLVFELEEVRGLLNIPRGFNLRVTKKLGHKQKWVGNK